MLKQPPGNPYQSQVVENADRLKLVELLYEGAIRFVRRSIEAIEARDPEAAHNCILRAYAIVAELQATLDMEQGGEIAVNLERCYDFILSRLKTANINKQISALEEVLQVLEPLLTVWREAHGAQRPAAQTFDPDPALLPNSNSKFQGSTDNERYLAMDLVG